MLLLSVCTQKGWGFLKFYPRKQLMIGQWAARDEIRLEAQVSVVTGIHHTADSRQPGGTHLSSVTLFQNTMRQMLECGRKSDVTCVVYSGERDASPFVEFKAHSNVLTERSSYFRAALNGGMMETTSRRLHIEHCHPSVFKQLLVFLYTGACDLSGIGNTSPTIGQNSSSSSILLDKNVWTAKKITPKQQRGDSDIKALDDDCEEKEGTTHTPMETKEEVKIDKQNSNSTGNGNGNEAIVVGKNGNTPNDKEKKESDDDFSDKTDGDDNKKTPHTPERHRLYRKESNSIGQICDTVSDSALDLLCAADRFAAVLHFVFPSPLHSPFCWLVCVFFF